LFADGLKYPKIDVVDLKKSKRKDFRGMSLLIYGEAEFDSFVLCTDAQLYSARDYSFYIWAAELVDICGLYLYEIINKNPINNIIMDDMAFQFLDI
jgi:hypothetical protein